jgi:hypothetical protein
VLGADAKARNLFVEDLVVGVVPLRRLVRGDDAIADLQMGKLPTSDLRAIAYRVCRICPYPLVGRQDVVQMFGKVGLLPGCRVMCTPYVAIPNVDDL